CDDFFIAGTQNWITQVSASLVEIPNGVGPRGRGTSKPFDLGKYVPDPVAAFAASPNFREGRVVADTTPGLSFVKSFQRHQIRGQRSESRGQRNLQANAQRQTPNAERRTKEDRNQRSEIRAQRPEFIDQSNRP